jgi:hypothetical protein
MKVRDVKTMKGRMNLLAAGIISPADGR